MLFIRIIIFILMGFFVSPVWAVVDPKSVANNYYGIHIADPNDLTEAAKLVNSTGGKWGYVTLVISDFDRNIGKWQSIFDQMRRLHVIPIVRIATHVENGNWVIPKEGDSKPWAEFLTKLNWPIQNRYVALFNEPNHAKEWGGELNPESYAQILDKYSSELKSADDDFFILPAALDVSAGSTPDTMDAVKYWQQMVKVSPDIFTKIDGWNSHSYPNPGFSGSPSAFGRGTLYSYRWEIGLWSQYGLKSGIPVFITETGWSHSQGKNINSKLLSPLTVSNYLQTASDYARKNSHIVAITPFILNYQDEPFDHFSWRQYQSDQYYIFYDTYFNLPKINGLPIQKIDYEVTEKSIPVSLVNSSSYDLNGTFRNNGQNIVSPDEGDRIVFEESGANFNFSDQPLTVTEPEQKGIYSYTLTTPLYDGIYKVKISLLSGQTKTLLEEGNIRIIPPPSLEIKPQLAFKKVNRFGSARTIIRDDHDHIIYAYDSIANPEGTITISALHNMIPYKSYTLELIIPNYLPQKSTFKLFPTKTVVDFKHFWPLDLNGDHGFSLLDIKAIYGNNPLKIIKLWF